MKIIIKNLVLCHKENAALHHYKHHLVNAVYCENDMKTINTKGRVTDF
jgi:hypothetical protein